jgi:hypothetical protein
VFTYNKDADPTPFRICCATYNMLPGAKGAAAVTQEYIDGNNLL